MVARERNQGGVALHSTTLGCTLAAEELQDAIVAAFEEALTTGHPDAVRRAEAAEILMSPGLRPARAALRGGDPEVGHPPGDPGHAQGYDSGGAEGPDAAAG